MKNVLFLFILLAVLSANRMFSQNMFEGKLIYVQEMDKGLVSETQIMEYHKNGNVLTVMPDMKLKLLYRQDLGKLVSIQDMAGTPVITQKNLKKTDTVELEFADGLEQKGVFSCVRVTSMTQSNMMRGVNRSLVDTSYRIPYNYGAYLNIPHGLLVEMESEAEVKGMKIKVRKRLIEVVEGEVDPLLFALPEEEGAVLVRLDEDGRLLITGRDSLKMSKMVPLNSSGKVQELFDDKQFVKRVGKGTVLLDFGARWCVPCRQMDPVMESLAVKNSNKCHVLKIDIDQCPKTAEMFHVTTVPTVVLLSNGLEIARFTGGGHTEAEIWRWVRDKINGK